MTEWEYVAAADSAHQRAAADGRFTQYLVSLYATRATPRAMARDADDLDDREVVVRRCHVGLPTSTLILK